MAKINNSNISKNLVDGAKINISTDKIPSILSDVVVPTMEVNPKALVNTTIVRTATAAGTIYTTPTNQDFYLTGITLSGSNGTASQASNMTITLTPKDEAAVVAAAISFRTTAILDTAYANQYFDFSSAPIKLARGTNISGGATNAATSRFIISGYVDETSLA